MRDTLDNGTPIEIHRIDGATRGLVVAPDIFGLRPLFDDLVARFATEWGMTTIAVEPFPTETLGPDIDPRYAAVARLDDAADDCADVELLRALLVLSLGAALDDDAFLVFGDTPAEGGLRLVVVGRVWSVTRSGLVRIFREKLGGGRRRDDFGHTTLDSPGRCGGGAPRRAGGRRASTCRAQP